MFVPNEPNHMISNQYIVEREYLYGYGLMINDCVTLTEHNATKKQYGRHFANEILNAWKTNCRIVIEVLVTFAQYNKTARLRGDRLLQKP